MSSKGSDSESSPLLRESPPKSPLPPYDASEQENVENDDQPSGKFMAYLYNHRKYIPGYGLIKLFREASLYSIFVLFIMLMAYLLNQLDRYTLSITAKFIGLDLQFGELNCLPGLNSSELTHYGQSRHYFVDDLLADCNRNSNLTNESTCLSYTQPLTPSGANYTEDVYVCQWAHDGGKGIEYQVLAGPVFNNVYPFAGIFMGFLADNFNRKWMLAISVLFWSLATGFTGLATKYWMLVIFRMLLAIGAAGCTPFAVSIISDYFPLELRGSALGIYYWGIYFGYSLAYAIGNGINIALNWHWVFYISGIMGVVLAPIIVLTVKEPKRKDNPRANLREEEERQFSQRSLILWLHKAFEKTKDVLKTFFMPGMFCLCIAAGIRNAGGYVWAYNTQPFFELFYTVETITSFMYWIPLVGGSIGAAVGGVISDILAKKGGPYLRTWVLIVSQLLAAPFAAGALFLPYPWCFLSLLPANIIGEMWVGVSSAIVVDLAPSQIKTTVIAVYLFIITIIGGNFNLLVAPINNAFKNSISKEAAYQWTLFLTYPSLFAISSLLFLITLFLIRLDLRIKKKREQAMALNDPGRSRHDSTNASGF